MEGEGEPRFFSNKINVLARRFFAYRATRRLSFILCVLFTRENEKGRERKTDREGERARERGEGGDSAVSVS